MTFYLEAGDILILIGLFMGMGVAVVIVAQLLKGRSVGVIAEGYASVTGGMSQMFRKALPPGAEAFHIGERQFIVDLDFATTRESWNRWGGNHPVIRYHVNDARPMSNSFQAAKFRIDAPDKKTGKLKIEPDAIKPGKLELQRHQKPSSGTVNLIIRRKGAAIVITAARKASTNPWVLGAAMLVVGLGISYMLASFYHPGLVPAAPPGYYYKVEPIPGNATVVH